MIPHPPQINGYEIVHNQRLRFVTNASVALGITFQNLLDTLLLAASATAVYDIFETVRLNSVEVWAVPILGQASSVEVVFSGQTAGALGDQQIHTDTSMGIEPAHVKARPSRKSLASNFQLSAAGTAFTLLAPAGAVVDVSCTFRSSSFTGFVQLAQNVAVAATIGSLNTRGLDGKAIATTAFLPAVGGV
jgi:hypothetical protein